MKIKTMPSNSIRVKYLGPSYAKGARWSVRDADGVFPRRFYAREYSHDAGKDAGRVALEYARENGMWPWAEELVVVWAGKGEYVVYPQ